MLNFHANLIMMRCKKEKLICRIFRNLLFILSFSYLLREIFLHKNKTKLKLLKQKKVGRKKGERLALIELKSVLRKFTIFHS